LTVQASSHAEYAYAKATTGLPGTIRAYGVTSKTRLVSAPDIPTLDEAGLSGFDFSEWHGLWAPKAMPKNIIARLNAAVTDALGRPDDAGTVGWPCAGETFPRDQQTPEALRTLQKAEIEKWWPIIKAAGTKAE
jgi:tripartite-type tricarboxylate transporter receptor subunit TctC